MTDSASGPPYLYQLGLSDAQVTEAYEIVRVMSEFLLNGYDPATANEWRLERVPHWLIRREVETLFRSRGWDLEFLPPDGRLRRTAVWKITPLFEESRL